MSGILLIVCDIGFRMGLVTVCRLISRLLNRPSRHLVISYSVDPSQN